VQPPLWSRRARVSRRLRRGGMMKRAQWAARGETMPVVVVSSTWVPTSAGCRYLAVSPAS
jgi:hypothetical protein